MRRGVELRRLDVARARELHLRTCRSASSRARLDLVAVIAAAGSAQLRGYVLRRVRADRNLQFQRRNVDRCRHFRDADAAAFVGACFGMVDRSAMAVVVQGGSRGMCCLASAACRNGVAQALQPLQPCKRLLFDISGTCDKYRPKSRLSCGRQALYAASQPLLLASFLHRGLQANGVVSNAVKTILPSRTRKCFAKRLRVASLCSDRCNRRRASLLQALARLACFVIDCGAAPSGASASGRRQPCRRCRRGRRRPLQVRRTRSSGSANCDAAHPPARRARRRAGGGRPRYAQQLGSDQREAAPPRTSCKSWQGGSPASGSYGEARAARYRSSAGADCSGGGVYRYHTPESQHLAEHARREARLLADALHSDELTEADEWERALPQITTALLDHAPKISSAHQQLLTYALRDALLKRIARNPELGLRCCWLLQDALLDEKAQTSSIWRRFI